jgi:hypothetical protein
MAAAETREGGEAKTHGWGLLLVWIVGLLAAYVLSAGPAGLLVDKGVLPENNVKPLYAPLAWISWNFPAVSGVFRWYEHLWRG